MTNRCNFDIYYASITNSIVLESAGVDTHSRALSSFFSAF
jgi:hypothetical protein